LNDSDEIFDASVELMNDIQISFQGSHHAFKQVDCRSSILAKVVCRRELILCSDENTGPFVAGRSSQVQHLSEQLGMGARA
jgi:hypothetical protein